MQMDPPASYIAERLAIFDELYAVQQKELAEKAAAESKPIKIVLPDGKEIAGKALLWLPNSRFFSTMCCHFSSSLRVFGK